MYSPASHTSTTALQILKYRAALVKELLRSTHAAVQAKHTSQLAAGLCYYFVLSLFPCLIALAAALTLIPVPHLFEQIVAALGRFIPSDSMGLVRGILKDVVTPHGGSILSIGILTTVWAASGGIAALVEAVNVAYELPDRRSFIHRKLLAIALLFAMGSLMAVGLALLVAGPGFGRWVALKVGLGNAFVMLWPYLRWGLSIACVIVCIELIYTFGPTVRRAFRSTLPGAIVALLTWVLVSSALGVYLRNFAKLNKTYGTLAAAIALMLWLYWTAFSILIGANFNLETERMLMPRSKRRPEVPPQQATAA